VRKIIIAALVMVGLAGSVHAADAPLLSLSRFTVAAGVNRVWVSSGPAPLEFYEVGIYTAYNLTPHLSLAHSTIKAFEEDSPFETRVGVRLRLSVPQ
jgi:hypothetical protein